MAELEKKSRKELEVDIAWEKREKKILLICSAVCCGLGLIFGVVLSISARDPWLWFGGIWIGTGIGAVIGYVTGIPYIYKETMKERGTGEALKATLIGILIWFIIFSFIGPIGLLIRIFRINQRIKKYEKCLSEAGE